MKTKKTIYISIPDNRLETWSINEAKKAQNYYEKYGFEVYNPHELSCKLRAILLHEPTEFQRLTYSLDHLIKADLMAIFPEYPNSLRCCTEILLASIYGTPIVRVYTKRIVAFKETYSSSINNLLKSNPLLEMSKFNMN